MIWVFKLSYFFTFLFMSIYNQRTTLNCYFTSTTKDWFIARKSFALGPQLGAWHMHYLYISCSTWHNHCWLRVVVFSTISIAVTDTTVPTSRSSGRTQHRQANTTVITKLLPIFLFFNLYSWFLIFPFRPTRVNWHKSFPAEETHIRPKSAYMDTFVISVFIGNEPQTLWRSECLCTWF